MTTRGRYAPSPTGEIHLGNARTALVAWWACRRDGGQFVWRVEDIDRQRAVEGLAQRQMHDLHWLGLDWDEGPDRGGGFEPYVQSQRSEHYEAALRRLEPRLFPCRRSRKELASIASAPHAEESSPYPPHLRPSSVPPDWLDRVLAERSDAGAAVRLRTEPGTVTWTDLVFGEQQQDVQCLVGDFVLRRRDGVWAYQLAVVVDDAAMQVNQVVRGADLIDSTARQIVVQRALGVPTPSYAHVPLLLAEHGDKLSKRDAAATLESLRSSGIRADQIVGLLAWSLDLVPEPTPRTASELLEHFSWKRMARHDMVVSNDLEARLLAGGDALQHALRPVEEPQ